MAACRLGNSITTLRGLFAPSGTAPSLLDAKTVALLGEEKVLAYAFEGRRYDCGAKLGYLEATVDFGLKHPELADEFAAYLRTRCK